MKQEPLSLNLVKTIMVVTTFVCLGALVGAIGYLATRPKVEPVVLPPTEEESEIDISDWKTYRNEEYGFEMKYLKNWTIEEDNKFRTVTFINFDNTEEEVVIIRQKDIPRIALDKNFIEDVTIDGISVKLYHDTDAKTGLKKIDKVIFDIPNSEDDFYITGYGSTFNQMLSTFRFLE